MSAMREQIATVHRMSAFSDAVRERHTGLFRLAAYRLVPFTTLIGLCLLLIGCVAAHVRYLEEGTGHVTQQDIASKWGEPDEKQGYPSGQTWIYRFQRFDSMEHPIGCEGYNLQFDDRQVLTRWRELDC